MNEQIGATGTSIGRLAKGKSTALGTPPQVGLVPLLPRFQPPTEEVAGFSAPVKDAAR